MNANRPASAPPHRGGLATTAVLVATVLVTGACSTATPVLPTPEPAPDPLIVAPLDWNPGQIPLPEVRAVGEMGDRFVVCTDAGTTVLVGGAVAATEQGLRSCRSIARIPAGDGEAQWLVVVDAAGEVWRLRDGTWFESVSDRYGLQGEAVLEVTALGGDRVAFSLEGGLAVADGATVSRYDTGTLEGLTGAVGLLAGRRGDQAVVFDPAAGKARVYDLPGLRAVTLDENGRLIAASGTTLYLEGADEKLTEMKVSKAGAVGGLAFSGGRLWLALGDELAALEDGVLRVSRGAQVPPGATLVPARLGGVWALGAGMLAGFVLDDLAMQELRRWEQTVRPVFLGSCTPCHLPGGEAGVDLSSHQAWQVFRDSISERVVAQRTMPPPGRSVLSDEDRAILAAWLDQ